MTAALISFSSWFQLQAEHMTSPPPSSANVCICVVTFIYIQVYMHTMDLYEVKINLMLSHAVLDGGGGCPVFADSVLQNKRRERRREHMSHVAALPHKQACSERYPVTPV